MFRILTSLAMLLSSQVFAQSVITLTKDNTVSFNQPVSAAFVAEKQMEILTKHLTLSRTQPIYLVLDTPGGSVSDGNAFIDSVKAMGRPVHTITLFAASMGYQIVQELGNRYITPSGTLMSHRGSLSGLGGQVPGELNSRLKMIEYILDKMNERAAKRIGQDKKKYQESIVNELWLVGQDAVDKKNADQVVHVTCDKSLSGSSVKQVNTMFGVLDVEFANCPIITSPLSISRGSQKFTKNSDIYKEVKKELRKVHLSL